MTIPAILGIGDETFSSPTPETYESPIIRSMTGQVQISWVSPAPRARKMSFYQASTGLILRLDHQTPTGIEDLFTEFTTAISPPQTPTSGNPPPSVATSADLILRDSANGN
jgi:hypothetical protein